MNQLEFFKAKRIFTFGGELNKNRRKVRRILTTKNPIHLVMRADTSILKKNERVIKFYWNKFGRRFGIKTYRLAICSNHVHALIRIHSQELYNRFIQALTGALAKILKFKWALRPFTRIVAWGKAFAKAAHYVEQNWHEAEGMLPFRPRRKQKRIGSTTRWSSFAYG